MRRTRSSTGTAVSGLYNQSKNQEKNLSAQLDKTKAKNKKATGAAGSLNSECIDLTSITIDMVEKINTDKTIAKKLRELVCHSTIDSLFVNGC